MQGDIRIQNRGWPAMWFALATGPVAWGVRLLGSYILVATACRVEATGPQFLGLTLLSWAVLAITAGTGLLCVAAGVVSWRMLRNAQRAEDNRQGLLKNRTLLVGLSGLFLNVFFFATILLEGVAVFFLDICSGQSLAV